MLSSWLFGGPAVGTEDPLIREGHRAVSVVIDGERLAVDVDRLAESSGLFLQVKARSEDEVTLPDFPGGFATFRQIAELLSQPDDGERRASPLLVTEENALNVFEAARLLECPRVVEKAMVSPYMSSLTSRRAAELLECLLPLTAATSPAESTGLASAIAADAAPGDGDRGPETAAARMEEYVRMFLLETSMWQRTERAAVELSRQLDASDFVLGPALATGSLRLSLALLALHKQREEEVDFVSNALRPVSAMWKNWTDKPLRARVSWDRHVFALQCMRKRLLVDAGADVAETVQLCPEQDEPDVTAADLSDDVYSAASDRALSGLADFLHYVDIERAPPNWKAVLTRVLILSGDISRARDAFRNAFACSPATRSLVPTAVPIAWLGEVAEHAEASEVFLRALADYRGMSGEDVCDAFEGVLLTSLLPSSHCARLVLPSRLLDDLVGACFAAGKKAQAAACGSELEGSAAERCPASWSGQHVLWRLQHVGERLFEAAFVAQEGFLPHKWPAAAATADDLCGGAGRGTGAVDSTSPAPPDAQIPAEWVTAAGEVIPLVADGSAFGQLAPCPEPLVRRLSGSCLWDEGLLHVDLLRPCMEAARSSPQEPTLHFGRKVIMRHLWRDHPGPYCGIDRLLELWDLACWPLCEDAGLIREAFEYLKGANRELGAGAVPSVWLPKNEEAIFHMFMALDFSPLPAWALLSPWVPSQAQTLRLFAHQPPMERAVTELERQAEAASVVVQDLAARLDRFAKRLKTVEDRTVVNKSQINDAIVRVEERRRNRAAPTVAHAGGATA